jgi:hypothetical protein
MYQFVAHRDHSPLPISALSASAAAVEPDEIGLGGGTVTFRSVLDHLLDKARACVEETVASPER